MTDVLAGAFASGRIVDALLAFVLLEAILMIAVAPPGERARRTGDVVRLLLPGACLMLALRAALIDAAWTSIAGLLALSLVAHLWDLSARLKR